ncbi:hypothetical protein CesoFtcFv8_027779 [Champsocephalus esox]|uniref:Uncharacterized protein n=1 Tax=Champsocephalus esox TaxID=159716 RepID=A0AAN8AZ25_9TELE|nr:hypothetical protein CesoFtcFv8_027779 [Champsocephalus esox]
MGKGKSRAYLSALDMTGEEEGDFTRSFVSYPDCVHAPSVAGDIYLKQTKQVGVARCLDKLNFHTDKEEVLGGKKHLRPDNARAEPH